MTPSSAVSSCGGPGSARVKTHSSDVVEEASATSLTDLTSVLTSKHKLMPYPIVPVMTKISVSFSPRKQGVIRIPFMSSFGSVCGWVMVNHASLHILTAKMPPSFITSLNRSFGHNNFRSERKTLVPAPRVTAFAPRKGTNLKPLHDENAGQLAALLAHVHRRTCRPPA